MLFVAKLALSGPTYIASSQAMDFPLSINISVGYHSTYQSIDQKVTWTVKGVVTVDGRPNATSKAILIEAKELRDPVVTKLIGA